MQWNEMKWQPRAQHPFIYIGFDVRLAKSFNGSGKKFFSQNCVLGRYGTGCGFPIRNLEGQKNARWMYRNLPLPSIHWHAHDSPHIFGPFITVSGVHLWLFLLCFFFQKTNLPISLWRGSHKRSAREIELLWSYSFACTWLGQGRKVGLYFIEAYLDFTP